MYFGDGAVNDLDDWSNFLEVPDFMASFNSSQVRARQSSRCPSQVVSHPVKTLTGGRKSDMPDVAVFIRWRPLIRLGSSSPILHGRVYRACDLMLCSPSGIYVCCHHICENVCRSSPRGVPQLTVVRTSFPPSCRDKRRTSRMRQCLTSRSCRCATPPAWWGRVASRARPAPCAAAQCPARRSRRGPPRRMAWCRKCRC